MTDDEKIVVKRMNNLICETLLKTSVLQAILQVNIPDWQAKVASHILSPDHQTLQRENEKLRQSIDLLIDQNNLTALRRLIPNSGQSN